MNFTFLEYCIFLHMLIYIIILLSGIIGINLMYKNDTDWRVTLDNADPKEIQRFILYWVGLGAIPVVNLVTLTTVLVIVCDLYKDRKSNK